MAKKTKPLRGNGRDGRDYGSFMAQLLAGTIIAVNLDETSVPDGNQSVTLKQQQEDGTSLPDVVVNNVPKRRVTKLDYDEDASTITGHGH